MFLVQLIGEKVVAVHIKLETERGSCGNPEIAEPEFFVNEIEIVMKAFALIKFQECLPRRFIMPWFISIATFHGRKDMDQAFRLPCFGYDLLDTVIFAEGMKLADEFN